MTIGLYLASMKRFFIAFVIAFVYLVVGNVVTIYAAHNSSNALLNAKSMQLLFAPYTFIAGMSEFAGWGALSYFLEAVIFIITIPFFYSLLVVVSYLRRRYRQQQ